MDKRRIAKKKNRRKKSRNGPIEILFAEERVSPPIQIIRCKLIQVFVLEDHRVLVPWSIMVPVGILSFQTHDTYARVSVYTYLYNWQRGERHSLQEVGCQNELESLSLSNDIEAGKKKIFKQVKK